MVPHQILFPRLPLPSMFIHLTLTLRYVIYRARVCCHRPGKYMTQIGAYLSISGIYGVDKRLLQPCRARIVTAWGSE